MKKDINNAEPRARSSVYDHLSIEPKWQSKWQEEKIYQPDLSTANLDNSEAKIRNSSKGPFYNLMMFPYPSAEGLHVGNMYAFTGADVYGRFKRQQGFSVFEPIGLDGFGIHSENYALKVGSHPMDQAEKSEKNFYRQLHTIGNSYDWSRTVETYKPEYYRWTQWLFIELFKAGLAYRQKSPVNFCPSCKTVLADEQVVEKVRGETPDGGVSPLITVEVCERCNTPVEKKDLEQWFFRITEYADRLLDGLDKIDWTEKVKQAQKNWIGRSDGVILNFTLEGSNEVIEVFTTRPDTLYGVTFMVLSPDHPFVASFLNLKIKIKNLKLQEVQAYVERARAKSDVQRRLEKDKSGVFSGAYAINPANGKLIPIWIADYVLMGYGTGAIMAVPAHDERDFDFAQKYNLPIVPVIEGATGEKAYIAKGSLINSGTWDGWQYEVDSDNILSDLEDKQIGVRTVQYHLRDWLISRQRYWGPPIPMVYCENCAKGGRSWFTTKEAKAEQVSRSLYLASSKKDKIPKTKYQILNTKMAGWYPAEDLPVLLPKIEDYKPLGTHSTSSGQADKASSPLDNHPEFYETTCPSCGEKARRETDVSDTFLDSSWYFLRYLATDLKNIPFPSQKAVDEAIRNEQQVINNNQKTENSNNFENWKLRIENSVQRTAWLPVTMYIGGAEHSVLHLLYTRFFYKVLVDRGYIDPSKGEEPFPTFFAHGLIIKDGAKMSKSKGNVVVPDDYISKYGADALRTYLMFIGPFSQGGDFSDSGIEGIYRFMKRVWKLVVGVKPLRKGFHPSKQTSLDNSLSIMHQTIKDVTVDIENLHYNTAIAKIMTYYNHLKKQKTINKKQIEVLLKLLAPFAPHMTEELWERLGNSFSIHTAAWPAVDVAAIKAGETVVAVQVNGKLRDTLHLGAPGSSSQIGQVLSQNEIEGQAKELGNVKKHLLRKEIIKVIYVPGKIINFVVS